MREKKGSLKKESEAQKLLQKELTDDTREIGQFLLLVGKVLLKFNLETKLARLEATYEKLVEVYNQGIDTEAAVQFQNVLDEDTDFIEGIIDKISQLQVLKEEVEKKRREMEAHHNSSLEQRVTQVQELVKHLQSSSHSTEVASIWSLGPMT